MISQKFTRHLSPWAILRRSYCTRKKSYKYLVVSHLVKNPPAMQKTLVPFLR